jgi:hypothetical protein
MHWDRQRSAHVTLKFEYQQEPEQPRHTHEPHVADKRQPPLSVVAVNYQRRAIMIFGKFFYQTSQSDAIWPYLISNA